MDSAYSWCMYCKDFTVQKVHGYYTDEENKGKYKCTKCQTEYID